MNLKYSKIYWQRRRQTIRRRQIVADCLFLVGAVLLLVYYGQHMWEYLRWRW